MQARVLVVASEAVPFAKTGGLGDVISPMARSLARRGVHTSLLLPAYPSALRQARNAVEVAELGDLPGGPGRILATQRDGVSVLLLRTARFDAHEGPYVDDAGNEHHDNALRFADLAHAADRVCASRTALEAPHVVHLHDWHAALLPMIQRACRAQRTPSVLTIHNLAFQGAYPMPVAAELGIPGWQDMCGHAEFWGRFNFLKAGIRFADTLSTVSVSYAEEILTPRFGCGLSDALRARKADLVAIANGIDANCWGPDTDRSIPAAFSIADMRGKAICKQELQAAFGLRADSHAPLLALGSRLTHQKMADVALDALPLMLARCPGLQIAVHGCGDHEFERRFAQLAAQHGARMGVRIGYEERLAHLLHAGADLLLHGSRFEPFGLTPIYAMRYGCVSIASNVGGLRDTIVDAGNADIPHARATGILFGGEGVDDMVQAIQRALAITARAAPKRVLQRNGMARTFDWDRQAGAYIDLYRRIVAPPERELFRAAELDARRTGPQANAEPAGIERAAQA